MTDYIIQVQHVDVKVNKGGEPANHWFHAGIGSSGDLILTVETQGKVVVTSQVSDPDSKGTKIREVQSLPKE